jgi:exodeoxyribonuclease-3
MATENASIAAFKVWIFPSLVSLVSLLIWNDVNEIKADVKDLSDEIVSRKGYFPYFFSAQKKGYSGVAVYTKNKPIDIQLGLNIPDFDSEGRNIILNYQNFILVNSYFPSGTTGEDRQRVKDQYLDSFARFCVDNEFHNKKVVLCGDFNICREPIDIHNPVSNKNSSGFLPHERKWFSEFLNLGFVDAFSSVAVRIGGL